MSRLSTRRLALLAVTLRDGGVADSVVDIGETDRRVQVQIVP